MSILLRFWATCVVATKRLIAQKGLTLATALGLTMAVGLTMSVPIYSDGVFYRLLYEELSQAGSANQNPSAASQEPRPGPAGQSWARPPFSFLFRYLGTLHGRLEWEQIRAADSYLAHQAGLDLRLPQKHIVRHFRTDPFGLYPPGEIDHTGVTQPLARAAFGFVSGLKDHVTLIEESYPEPSAPNTDMVDVLVSESFARRTGVQVGQTYSVFARRNTGSDDQGTVLPVRVAGVWKATDPQDAFWFYHPSALSDLLLVPEATFAGRIAPYLRDEIALALWYLVMDGSEVHAPDINPLLGRITRMQQQVSARLPNTELDPSTVEALLLYRRSAGLLTILLYAFSIPTISLTLAFVGMVVGLSVEGRRNEIAVLRSRGATTAQVVAIGAQEVLLVGGLALIAGSFMSQAIAHLMGQTRSFLDFTTSPQLRADVTMPALRAGLVAIGLALLAQIVPTLAAARQTVVTHKQEQARLLRSPWWQRVGLDLLLLVPAAYGAYVLRKQGSIALAVPLGDTLTPEILPKDPFQNPLLFLVPALSIAALTLFMLRVLPVAMRASAWLLSRTRSVGFLLAARHLARRGSGFYAAPLALLVLTLSLSAFTASLAQTLDRHLYDQTYYEVGTDLRAERRYASTAESAGTASAGSSTEDSGEASAGDEEWLVLPTSEYLKIPGVRAVARVGLYEAITRLSGGTQAGTFIGIDRTEFPRVAFWRRDFASARLGTLMNALALAPEGVLASSDFMAKHALRVGDRLQLQVEADPQRTGTASETVSSAGQLQALDTKIVGSFDLFPSWYPESGPLFVGNLEYLFDAAGLQFPYDLWMRVGDPMLFGAEREADYDAVIAGLRRLRFPVGRLDVTSLTISSEQRRPERQGLYGLLSVGFVAASVLTVTGFLIYAVFSFRRRFIELGILRAIGLSPGQMAAFVAWELSFLVLIGAVVGTGLGVWTSSLFIPYLQVGTGPSARTPPFIVEIAWPEIFRVYGLFAVLFLIALGILVPMLLRMRIFEAVKLGESI